MTKCPAQPDHRSDASASGRTPPAWMDWLLAGPGPIALGAALMILTPLTLTWTGRPWLGLVVMAGAALFWWTIMWVGRHVATPRILLIVPIVIVLAVVLARPLSADPKAFFIARWDQPPASADAAAFMLDRENAMVATQKLVVVLLLVGPMLAAMRLGRWTASWFRIAMLVGICGLLVMTMLQLVRTKAGPADPLDRANLAMFTPMPAQHVAAVLTAAAVWLFATAIGAARAWTIQRDEQHDEYDDGPARPAESPHLLLAILSSLVLAGAVAALLAVMLAGESWAPWRQTAPWLGIGCGLTLLIMAPKPAFRIIGIGVLAVGLSANLVQWPGRAIWTSLTRGGLFGWGGHELHPLDFPGLLSLLEWRGLIGVAAVLASIALAAALQLQSVRRVKPPHRIAAGGAMVASWLLCLGWLIGPGYVTGSAALFAMALWAMSLGSEGSNTPRTDRNPFMFMLLLAAAVIGAYGLVGLTPMAHDPLWIPSGGPTHDKLLHGVWGLYVTLVCCLGLSPLGRWVAAIAGTACSLMLAVAAEFIEVPIGRRFDMLDVLAYAAAAATVMAALLAVPYPWPMRRGQQLSNALVGRQIG